MFLVAICKSLFLITALSISLIISFSVKKFFHSRSAILVVSFETDAFLKFSGSASFGVSISFETEQDINVVIKIATITILVIYFFILYFVIKFLYKYLF